MAAVAAIVAVGLWPALLPAAAVTATPGVAAVAVVAVVALTAGVAVAAAALEGG